MLTNLTQENIQYINYYKIQSDIKMSQVIITPVLAQANVRLRSTVGQTEEIFFQQNALIISTNIDDSSFFVILKWIQVFILMLV